MKREDLTLVPPEELFESMAQMLREGYDAEFTVTGNSMWPFLCHNRDRVILRHCEKKDMKKGEIVLFCPVPGRYLLHRIDKIKGGSFRTTGDGNCFHDGMFSLDCIIGRVVTVIRKGKTIHCQRAAYRLGSGLWMLLYPVRPVMLGFLRMLAKWKGAVKKHDY